MDLLEMIFSFVRLVFGLALIFFIPGFAMSWALFVTKDEIPVLSRVALSFVMSLAIVMLSSLFLDYVIGIDATALNITITLCAFILLMIVVWEVRSVFLARTVREERPNL